MRVFTSLLSSLALLSLAGANPLLENDQNNGPTKTDISLCCCCLKDSSPGIRPDPNDTVCPREAIEDVCGNDYPANSRYTLGGLEGNPEAIEKECSRVRCRPIKIEE